MKDYELDETILIKRLIKNKDVVLDLGANIGQYTLLMSDLVGENGKVYAFEPNEESFKLLKERVKLRDNIFLEKKAVLNKNGRKRFYMRDDNPLSNSFYKFKRRLKYSFFSKRKYIEVETIKLDDYFSKNERINFIKMDIEGSEFSALKGMENLIKRNKDVKVFTEFYPELINGVEGFDCATEYLNFIRSFGFNIFSIYGEKLTNQQIMNICEEKQYLNLICLKRGKNERRKSSK